LIEFVVAGAPPAISKVQPTRVPPQRENIELLQQQLFQFVESLFE